MNFWNLKPNLPLRCWRRQPRRPDPWRSWPTSIRIHRRSWSFPPRVGIPGLISKVVHDCELIIRFLVQPTIDSFHQKDRLILHRYKFHPSADISHIFCTFLSNIHWNLLKINYGLLITIPAWILRIDSLFLIVFWLTSNDSISQWRMFTKFKHYSFPAVPRQYLCGTIEHSLLNGS